MEPATEHLEHVEHPEHAAHSPFDRHVAMTMAIVAASLACVTMLSHRAHTDTLRLQTEASILQTRASDRWSYYQAKNIREHEYRTHQTLLSLVAKEPGKETASEVAQAEWSDQAGKYQTELPQLKAEAEELEHQAQERQEESHHFHQRGGRFDLGELGIELSLVLCSLAVLTKRPEFWYSGIGVGVLGMGASLSAFLMH